MLQDGFPMKSYKYLLTAVSKVYLAMSDIHDFKRVEMFDGDSLGQQFIVVQLYSAEV